MIFGGGGIADAIHDLTDLPHVQCDVTSYAQVHDAMSTHPAVIVNCAGVSHPNTVRESDPDDWTREVTVNLVGSYHIAKAAPLNATLIFIASVSGLYGKANHSGYCASKAGVISLVRSLAREGRKAYAISPGRVDTPMRERDYPGEDPLTRLTPLEVAETVQGIIAGTRTPGDNIIIRKIGYDTFFKLDRGEPWYTYLAIGQPARY